MATCNKCKNKYFSKECPYCKKEKWKEEINKNNHIKYNKQNKYIKKEFKEKTNNLENNYIKINKNIAIIITAIATSIIALILIFKMYQDYQNTQTLKKAFYGTTDEKEIEKINQEWEKEAQMFRKRTKELEKQLFNQ